MEKDCRESRSGNNNNNDVGKENTVDRNITSRILSFVVVLLQLPSFSFLPNLFSFFLSSQPHFPYPNFTTVSNTLLLYIEHSLSLSL